MSFFIFNDKIFEEDENIVSPDSRGLRYGDGLFETIKVCKGNIKLADYHFQRLFSGMEILKFVRPAHLTADYLQNKIIQLYKKNAHNSLARLRLMIFRSNGGLNDAADNLPNWVIQSWELTDTGELNSNGLILDIYDAAKKSCDILANIKSNNFLPYVMAAMHAKEIKVNDCIILNNYNRICDTTIANIFLIRDNIIYTPPLSEGCIAGVMRRFVIEKLQINFTLIEKEISIDELQNADEVFITNSIKGIRWVKQFRNKEYSNNIVKEIHKRVKQLLI
jgi:branched-chain amino acid aminotransferase